MKALVLQKTEGDFKPGKCYHPSPVVDLPIPVLEDGEVLVKIKAAAFNHRDLFIRQSLYPGVVFSTPDQPSIHGADGAGILVAPRSHPLHGRPVLLVPHVNWSSSPRGPDAGPKAPFGILGCVRQTGGRGTFAEYIKVRADDVVERPAHFADSREGWAEAAAAPLAGLTAYRAVFTKGQVEKGQNVLITGIGGGVAIFALQFCVAAGANVWVTSSSPDKIARAEKLGAKGGVNYRDEDWPKQLGSKMNGALLDVVIDSAGGPIVTQVLRNLKDGGRVSCYGQTTGKALEFNMGAVLKNIDLKGSTMGSAAEFKEAVSFIQQHKIKPVVHEVLEGLESAEKGFEEIKRGGQFGKIVIYVERAEKSGRL